MFRIPQFVSRQRRVALALLMTSGISVLAAWRTGAAPPTDAPRKLPVVVTGWVRDAVNARPLEGVEVAVVSDGSAPASGRTSADGRYRVNALVAQRRVILRITVRRAGYAVVQGSAAANGDTVRFDVKMTPLAQQAAVERGKEIDRFAKVAAMSISPLIGSPASAGSVAHDASYRARTNARAEARGAARDERTIFDSSRTVDWNREQYDRIQDNPFLAVHGNPRSTFSVDVDRASYGNVRRFLTQGQLPPADAVRIEELVNYFPYRLAEPRGDAPVAITTEVIAAPWQPRHQLVRVALQARRIDTEKLPPSNLVFLIDVSGSMMSPDKLPLVKQSLRLLVEQLREQDRVALVVYAGAAGLVLKSTPGSEKATIMEAIDRLEAGGSTAGGAGLELAYRTAREHFERGGNNRVILATDGDFNVGTSSDAAMERLVESKRAEGTYLTVLGFGTGNYQDAKMEKMAKVGNGNYAYVDDLAEARKVLVHEMGATLVTVANDVKLQIEFNPARVAGYRLIGYEDRLLRDEDFADDKKDAGDMGAGHSVTALYEIVPVGVRGTVTLRESEPLRYTAAPGDARGSAAGADELLHVSLRYKRPGESNSRLVTSVVRSGDMRERGSDDLRFASAVASFGMLLRNSEYKGTATGPSVLALARGAKGEDEGGYRAEFMGLVERWQEISRGVAVRPVRDR